MADLRELVEAVRYTRGRAECDCDCDDKQAMRAAEANLLDHLLTHPEAVEAYEAVLAYGLARKAAHGGEEMTEEQWRASLEDRAEKHRAIFALADRLAAKGGE